MLRAEVCRCHVDFCLFRLFSLNYGKIKKNQCEVEFTTKLTTIIKRNGQQVIKENKREEAINFK